MRISSGVAAVVVVGVVLGASSCSGGDSGGAAVVTTTSSSLEVTTTIAAPTTTVETTVETTTTTAASAPSAGIAPLTGMPSSDARAIERPALVVKIDNHPSAVPQAGLGEADVVIEELVEGISRFAAVFQSASPGRVGPIRSARTTDIALLGGLRTPLLAWSGGNAVVTKAVARADLVDVGALAAWDPGGYVQDSSRRAPHNLYADTDKLFALAQPSQPPAPALFAYGDAVPGMPASAVSYDMGATGVRFTWDAATRTWVRHQDGALHEAEDGRPLAVQNVVVASTKYVPSKADKRSPEAQTVGTGPVTVLRDGVAVSGTWVRETAESPWTFLTPDGTTIALAPGQTWLVLLPKTTMATIA